MPAMELRVIWDPMVFDAHYFHMLCQGISSFSPHARQAHIEQAKTIVSISFTSFPTTRFRVLRIGPKKRKNVVDLFAGAFQKTTPDFIQLFMLLWFVFKLV